MTTVQIPAMQFGVLSSMGSTELFPFSSNDEKCSNPSGGRRNCTAPSLAQMLK